MDLFSNADMPVLEELRAACNDLSATMTSRDAEAAIERAFEHKEIPEESIDSVAQHLGMTSILDDIREL